jgi:tripartite-type tricarboxylate transporter receptor subunit TctC
MKNINKIKYLLIGNLASLLTLAVAQAAHSAAPAANDAARDYPNRPIRYILPGGPGSSADVFSRILTAKLSDILGQQIVIDSRPGAGGMMGVDIASKATPDGYTIARGNLPGLAIAPHVYTKMPYDALKDLLPVSLTDVSHNLLVVHPSVAATSMKELIALMKARPDQLIMASPGVASGGHLAGVLLTSMAGVRSLHVPYKAAGPSIISVVSNESQWAFASIGAPLPHVRAGRLRALAVGGEKRSIPFPDVPTAAEAGLPGYFSMGWAGVVVPRGTPPAIIAKLNAATVKALNSPDLKELFLTQGAEPAPGTPEEFARYIRADYDRIAKLVKVAGLKVD